MQQVVLPNTLEKIGCSALNSINFPEGLAYIDASAFEATDPATVALAGTLQGVREAAFMQGNKLQAINVGYNCQSLTQINPDPGNMWYRSTDGVPGPAGVRRGTIESVAGAVYCAAPNTLRAPSASVSTFGLSLFPLFQEESL